MSAGKSIKNHAFRISESHDPYKRGLRVDRSHREEAKNNMKDRLLRGLGIAALVAMPLAGVAFLSGPASAATGSTMTPSFKFTSPTLKQTVSCPKLPVSFTGTLTTTGYQQPCTVTGTGSFKTIPHTSTSASFLIPVGGLQLKTSKTKLLVMTASFKLTYGTHGHCTITYATIQLSKTGKSYIKNGSSTKGNVTVTGSGSVCTTIKTLLAGNTSKFNIGLKFTPAP